MDKYVELTARVISNFLANQHVSVNEVPQLIQDTYKALWEAGNPSPKFEPEVQRRRRRQTASFDSNAPIVDEHEAEEKLIEDVAQDNIEPTGERIPDAENVVTGWHEDEETGERTPPEPMFHD